MAVFIEEDARALRNVGINVLVLAGVALALIILASAIG